MFLRVLDVQSPFDSCLFQKEFLCFGVVFKDCHQAPLLLVWLSTGGGGVCLVVDGVAMSPLV